MGNGFYIFLVGAMQEILSGQVKTDPSCLFRSPIRTQDWIYCISSNNSRPLINRLPRIIAPRLKEIYKNCIPQIIPPPHALQFHSAKLISDNSSSEN